MAIKYVLRKNNLVEEPDIYAAGVQISGSVGLEQIADRIVEQGTTVRRADVLAVLENAITAIDTLLLDGFRVNLGGLCDLFPRIRGKFEGPSDSYDPSRHKVDVSANPGKRIRSAVREQATVEKQQTIKPVPDLVSYGNTGLPGSPSIGTITGYRLKFNTDQGDEGIFFVSTTDASETRVSPPTIQLNKPSRLVFLNPTLSSGTYWLEVRTRYTPEGELRVGRFDGAITIQ